MNTTETIPEQKEQYLQPLTIGKHTSRYPIIQGGMGVRVSTPEMASEVILSGGIGTLSQYDYLKHLHIKGFLMKQSQNISKEI